MKCTVPTITWHNWDPVLSVDFQCLGNQIRRLATGGMDTHVLIWMVTMDNNGQVQVDFVSDLTRHNRAVNIVRFSPDGKFLASADDEAAIWLWKLNEKDIPDIFADENERENKEHWTPVRSLRSHVDDVCDLSWSKDSNFLISGSVDNTAILWDVAKGRNNGILSDHKGFVQGVAWDPLNKYVATLSSDRSCRIYNINSKKLMYKVHKMNLPQSSAGTEQTSPPKQTQMFHDDTLKSFCRRLTFTPNGELLIAPAGALELEDNKKMNVTYIFSRHSLNKPAMYLPAGDKRMVVVRCCPVLFELRQISKKTVRELIPNFLKDEANDNSNNNNDDDDAIHNVFNLPYRIVFAIATHNSVLFYDTQQPVPFAHVSNLHYTRLTDLAWSEDGRILIVSSTDGVCSFITFNDGELGTPYNAEQIVESVKETASIKNCEKSQVRQPEVALISENANDVIMEDVTVVEKQVENHMEEESSDLKLVLELTNDTHSRFPTNATENETKQSDSKDKIEKMVLDVKENNAACSSSAIQLPVSAPVNLPAGSIKKPRRVQFITLSAPKNTK